MFALVFLLITPFTIYIACKKPEWFWTAWVCGPLILETMSLQNSAVATYSWDTVQIGPILFRDSDQAVLAMMIAIGIYIKRHGIGTLFKKPGGTTMFVFLVFVVLKTAYSVLLAGDLILQNRVTSHMAGGLVAALGDARDGLSAFFPPFYAYFIKKSRDLKALGWPIVVCICLLLVNWVCGVLTFGHIWTGNINPLRRPINAGNAIDLTVFSMILLFLPVSRIPLWATRSLATFALVVAILANHRSQWMACVAGAAVLIPILLLGKPLSRKPLLSHASFAGVLCVLVCGTCLLNFFPKLMGEHKSLYDDLEIRLYAFTEPSKDPDSKWRNDIWHDRVVQVGNNWPWGRPLGARAETLIKGKWLEVPDHSAYVSAFEMGGIFLCLLLAVFFGQLTLLGFRQITTETEPRRLWPAAIGLTTISATLAFGGAYYFQALGPAMIVVLLLSENSPGLGKVRVPAHMLPQPAYSGV